MTTDPQAPKPNQGAVELGKDSTPEKDSKSENSTAASEMLDQEITEGADKTVPSESADGIEQTTDAAVENPPAHNPHDESAEASEPEAATEQTATEPEAPLPADGATEAVEPSNPEESTDSSQENTAGASENPESSADSGSTAPVAAKGQQPAVQSGKQVSPAADDDDDDDDEEYEDDEDEYEDEDEEEEEEHDGRMSLFDHLKELKKRLIRAFIAIFAGFLICYAFAEELFNFLVQPLLKVLPHGSKLIYTGLPEAFFTYMKVAFVAGCFLASPAVFYQIWAFIAPGLYDEEKRHILPVAIFSAFFFILGGAFAYYIAFPFAFEFFMSYSTDIIEAQPKLNEYLSLSLQLLFAFGLIFELPLFTFFLAKMGLVTAAGMRKYRRYAILTNFIVAALLTPPDVMSQLLMAFPMMLLYEISILVAQAVGKKGKEPVKQDEATGEATDDADDDDTEDEEADEQPAGKNEKK